MINTGGEVTMTIADIKEEGLMKIARIAISQDGYAKGSVEGWKIGFEEGWKIGFEEGRLEEIQWLLFDRLHKHYNDLPQKSYEMIQKVQDRGILERLFDISYRSRSTASFEKKALRILASAR
jgi:flagellar biosynthesis/type III secretory pathway protein FliH